MTEIASKYVTLNADHYVDPRQWKLQMEENSIARIGIVNSAYVDEVGRTKYKVEVFRNGKNMLMACIHMTRFGGHHNFEEFHIRGWVGPDMDPKFLGSVQVGDPAIRAGDMVVVIPLNGNAREGVILGGMKHSGREQQLQEKGLAYLSVFQGLETSITEEGDYKVTYNGKPINTELALENPIIGGSIPEPSYNSSTAGSFFQFDDKGSFTIADANGQIIKMKKQTGNIVIVSGDRRIELGAEDNHGIQKDGLNMLSDFIHITATDCMNITATDDLNFLAHMVSINTQTVAIGNSDWELIDQIEKLVDLLGALDVIAPNGKTTPLMAGPNWAKVEEWKTLMCSSIKGEIQEIEPIFNTNF